MLTQTKEAELDSISFQLTDEQAKALQTVAGGKNLRVSGFVHGGKLIVDFLTLGGNVISMSATPFKESTMAPFIACNGPMPGQE